MTPSLRVDLWSDPVCPWCWIGKRRLEAALADLGRDARWTFHAYELSPRDTAPEPTVAALARKYGVTPEEALEMMERVRGLGAELGLVLRPETQVSAPTFDAHRLIQARQAEGDGDARALVEALHRAHFTDGRDLSRREVLLEAAAAGGWDPARAAAVLDGNAFADAVDQDERRGAALGVQGVPFAVLEGTVALSGAQSPARFREAILRAGGAA